MKESDIEISAGSAAVDADVHKIVVVLREDLEPWKRLNVTAFTISGVAAVHDVVGARYRDASGSTYLPMFTEPVVIFGATADEMKRTADRARSRHVPFSIFTEQLFYTFNDEDNRAAVAAVATADLPIVGLAFRRERKIADKILKGLKLLR
ncbi:MULTISPECIES: DUF2000 domain-containing protein [unclassified Bradyrhizobium]|uniref:DUF2000 domain-containing protein n=1 Tax=unclassified Bradyrhizobium TaxID=2631580 RepID=UPI001FF93D9E|nr:DUF2000 domain-containing protein [Bradyrhizobium sp. 48]MCK1446707.1 DUF2000 domain-containing protein [Bradyrhizobium sp. 48]